MKIIIFIMQNGMILCRNVLRLSTIKQTPLTLTPKKVVEGESLDGKELCGPCI